MEVCNRGSRLEVTSSEFYGQDGDAFINTIQAAIADVVEDRYGQRPTVSTTLHKYIAPSSGPRPTRKCPKCDVHGTMTELAAHLRADH